MIDPMELPRILYYVIMAIALVGWMAIIFYPRKTWANFWVGGVIVPLILCGFYMYTLIAFWFMDPQMNVLNFLSLEGIYKMFGNDGMLLVAWLNLTTMDLVAGAWMTRKAAQTRMPIPFLIPCQIMTFVFVGFGFTLFALFCGVYGVWGEIAEVESEPARESKSEAVSVPASSFG